jgi:hypothetical protein
MGGEDDHHDYPQDSTATAATATTAGSTTAGISVAGKVTRNDIHGSTAQGQGQGQRSEGDNDSLSDDHDVDTAAATVATGQVAKGRASAKSTGEDCVDDDSKDPDGPEGPTIRRKGLAEIKEALDCIPVTEKISYMKAVEQAPSLVETESKAIGFLRCEKFNASAAARRLIKYWHIRCEIFGDRAFLPMIQTGTGALSRDDMVVLKTGSAAILPDHGSGRAVIYLDRSKLLDLTENSFNSRHRCMFYVLSAVAESVKAQRDGYLMMGVVVTPRFSEASTLNTVEFGRKSVELLKEVMPIRMEANHLLVCPAKAKEGDLLNPIIAKAVSVLQEGFIFHFSCDSSVILGEMKSHGFVEESLPPAFGGTWKFTEFAEWQKRRRRSERERVSLKSEDSFEASESLKMPAVLRGAEKKERKRKLNAIHSRHKRERRQAEFGNLEDECRELKREKVALEQEAERLEGLITCAQQQVAVSGSRAREE